MDRFGRVFITSVMVSVGFGRGSTNTPGQVEWIYGKSITTGNRYYLEPRRDGQSTSYKSEGKSYVVNDGIECQRVIKKTGPSQRSPVWGASVIKVDGNTREQKEYTVELASYNKAEDCFPRGLMDEIHVGKPQVLSELNQLCDEDAFRLIKGSTVNLPTDGKYCGKVEGMTLEIDVQDGKIGYVNATSPTRPIERLLYFTLGDVIFADVLRKFNSQASAYTPMILEPIDRKFGLLYDKIDASNLQYWGPAPPKSDILTVAEHTPRGRRNGARRMLNKLKNLKLRIKDRSDRSYGKV